MNGSENCYAGALFFALISLGAILKVTDFFGWIIGAVFAVLAAISLRLALVKAAQAVEEDHQRIEIQFQQLRNKVIETSETNIMAMNSINAAAKLIQENMEVIRVRLAELDNLTQLADHAKEIKSSFASLEKNSSVINVTFEKEFATLNALVQENIDVNRTQLAGLDNSTQLAKFAKEVKASVASLEENSSALNKLAETNKQSLQDILKIVRLIGHLLNNPAYVKDLEKINSSFAKISEWLETLQDSETLSQEDLSTLKKIAEKIK